MSDLVTAFKQNYVKMPVLASFQLVFKPKSSIVAQFIQKKTKNK